MWWAADAPLFDSIVHPGPDEGFVAVYPQWPAPDQRAALVAVVDRASLPTPKGMMQGLADGTTVVVQCGAQTHTLDLSRAAPGRTRTPPWDLVPRRGWEVVPEPLAVEELGWRETVALGIVFIAFIPLVYVRALVVFDGDRVEARQTTAVITAGLGSVILGAVVYAYIRAKYRGDADGGRDQT